MNWNIFTNFLKPLIILICKELINELITCYIYFKNSIEFIQKVYENKDYILTFDYKKLFLKIIEETKKHFEEYLKIIAPFIEYIIYKYILNHSFYKICFNYLSKLDYKHLKLHIFNKLDALIICKNKIKTIINFVCLFVLYIKEKNRKNFDELEFLLNNIAKIKISNFYRNLEKITKSFDIKIIKLKPFKEELEFFKNIFYKNYNKYILL
ncbi:hypothetical protein MACK_004167 (apicoplast) [Theileria orientalis]|uniref:Uncharacterized protein n=1 Tax=Theileria orientalis TaxID=68886 RepID=A0A976SI47_THEOR|nr:hypothetical protein MACK_004167 [Theileria orientalis]